MTTQRKGVLSAGRWREPAGRHDHSTAVVGEEVYLWAGDQRGMPCVHDSAEKRAFLSSVEVFNVNTGCWEQRTTHGTPPLAVWGYSCVAVRNDLYYFGGECGHGDCQHNSVHTLSTSTLQWRMLAPTTIEDEAPMKKSSCGVVHFTDGEEDLLFMVGGYGPTPSSRQPGVQYKQDDVYKDHMYTNEQHIFCLSTSGWSSLSVTGQPPLPCSQFTLTTVGKKRAAMYGGWDGYDKFDHMFIVELGRRSVHWSNININKPTSHSVAWPQERSLHAATHLSGPLFVIKGGMDKSYATLNDLWLCDTTTKLWKKLPLPDEYVAERWLYSVSTLQLGPHCMWLILFGGYPYQANTVIIELIQGGDGEWSVDRVLKRETLSNTVYQDMLREGRRKGRTIAELEQEIQYLQEKVQQLQEDKRLTQQHQLETEETLQQEIRQLTRELEAANRRTKEMEEENCGLHQQEKIKDVPVSGSKGVEMEKHEADGTLKASHLELKAASNEKQSVDTVDTGVQANYLAVAPGFLRGVEVYGETVLEVVGDKPQKLEWPGYGFYMEVPDGALAPGVTASVGVKVTFSGQFKLPDNRQLISAIYWISSSEIFLKDVAVNIQHFAVITSEEQCSKFRFVIAKCSQKELPYTFHEREGSFNPHTQYGAIKLKQFSLVGETSPEDTELRFTSLKFYKPIPGTLKVDFIFVVVCNHEIFLECIRQEYVGYSEDKQSFMLVFDEDVVVLDLPNSPPLVVDGWRILPLTSHPEIARVDIVQFKRGRNVPACTVELEWTGSGEPKPLSHQVKISGAKKPAHFYLRYYPQAVDKSPADQNVVTTLSTSSHVSQANPLNKPPELLEFLSQVASKARDKWEMIGLVLNIMPDQLNMISKKHHNPMLCYSEVFTTWKNKEKPEKFTWTTIVEALKSPVVEENKLAGDIVQWLTQ